MVTSHGEANHQAIQLPVHKARIARFINIDLEGWSTAVHDAALSAKSNWHEPPGIDELPGVVLPAWKKIGAYFDAAGWEHVDIHKDSVVIRDTRGHAGKRARRDADSAQLKCFGWASLRKGEPCNYRHDPAGQFQVERQRGGGASGAAHKKAKTGVGTAQVVLASGDGGGSDKCKCLAKPSKGADE